MKSIRSLRPARAGILAGFVVAALAGCSDNPVGDEHEDHPVGLVVVDAQGQDAVTLTEGPTVTGQLTAPAGGSRTYTVLALAEDGDRLALDGDELGMQVGASPQNATVTVQGVNQLVVTGAAAGTGTVRLELVHEGHAELGGDVGVVVQ